MPSEPRNARFLQGGISLPCTRAAPSLLQHNCGSSLFSSLFLPHYTAQVGDFLPQIAHDLILACSRTTRNKTGKRQKKKQNRKTKGAS